MAISVPQTASFDANLARELNSLPAALLYNQLLYTSQTDMAQNYDEDGWFYYTAERFEDTTTYNKDTFTRAGNVLVKAGFVEKQKRYIKGQSKSVTHFRFLKSWQPNARQTRNAGVVSNTKPIYKENNKENKFGFLKRNTESPSPFSSLSACGDSRPTNDAGRVVKITTVDSDDKILSSAEKTGYDEKTGELTVDVKVNPFAGEVREAKPKKDMLTPKAFALAQELMAIVDPRDKDVVSTMRLIKAALNRGTTEEELRLVARLSRSDNWYYNKPATTVFSKEGIKTLLASQKKREGGDPRLTAEARNWI